MRNSVSTTNKTNISGNDVANETIVIPIIKDEIFILIAREIDDLTKISPPK